MKSQILICATTPGAGKTTLALGLSRLLEESGRSVELFKSGPDLQDKQLHSLLAGADTPNVDPWIYGDNDIRHIYNSSGAGADVCLVDGWAALFDGYDRSRGSDSSLSEILRLPVVLVAGAENRTYSVAAEIAGFRHFNPLLRIAGVVFNRCVSSGQFSFLRRACRDAGVECLGYIPLDEALSMNTRHACFTGRTVEEVKLAVGRVAEHIAHHVDVDALLSRTLGEFPVPYSLPLRMESDADSVFSSRNLRIAVADDPAFAFSYSGNIERLASLGDVQSFSPVYSDSLPDADIIYLRGGFPELFGRQIHRRHRLLEKLFHFADGGGRIIAEGGGMSLLCRSLSCRPGGKAYEMAGFFDFDVQTCSRITSGYRRALFEGRDMKGYEFRYTKFAGIDSAAECFDIYDALGSPSGSHIFRKKNVIASPCAFYWGDSDIVDLF